MSHILTWLPLAIFPMVLCAPPQVAVEDLQATQAEILQKWQEGRDKLKSGKVLLTVTHNQGTYKSTDTIQYAFDFGLRSNKGTLTTNDKLVGAWTSTPFYLAVCSLDSPGAEILNINAPDHKPLHFVKRYDPRLFGNMIYSDFLLIPDMGQQNQGFSRLHLTSIQKLDVDRVEITWETGPIKGFNCRFVSVVNKTKDYTFEKQDCLVKGKQDKDWIRVSSTQVDWIKVEGVYVPDTVDCRGQRDSGFQVKCAWDKVNPTYRPRDFDYASLSLPKNTMVIDSRKSKGPGVIVDSIGKKFIDSLLPK